MQWVCVGSVCVFVRYWLAGRLTDWLCVFALSYFSTSSAFICAWRVCSWFWPVWKCQREVFFFTSSTSFLPFISAGAVVVVHCCDHYLFISIYHSSFSCSLSFSLCVSCVCLRSTLLYFWRSCCCCCRPLSTFRLNLSFYFYSFSLFALHFPLSFSLSSHDCFLTFGDCFFFLLFLISLRRLLLSTSLSSSSKSGSFKSVSGTYRFEFLLPLLVHSLFSFSINSSSSLFGSK